MTDAEEDLMFELGEFGDQDPEVLQRTVWWLLSLHLGFRTRDESRKLKWGNVKLQINGETGNKKKKIGLDCGERIKMPQWRRTW